MSTTISTPTTTSTSTSTSTAPGSITHGHPDPPDADRHPHAASDVVGIAPSAAPAHARHDTAALLAQLRDALWLAAELDPDELASRTSRGAALLALAARAREAVRALGAPAGVPLREGPGVVVVRDAASTAALLDAAFDPHLVRRLG